MFDQSPRRPYTLRRRAERQDATRLRIVQAAVDLHRKLGPSRTTITAVAVRAGVQRHTVYRYFPDVAVLFRACTAHFLAGHPPPDTSRWAKIGDPASRLRFGLTELYAYYAANEEMIANVLRDSAVMPVGGGFRALHAAAFETLISGRPAAIRSRAFTAGLRVAIDFRAWQALRPLNLSSRSAANLMCRLLTCA